MPPERLQRVEFSVPYTRDSLGMLSRRSQGLNFSVAQRLLGDSIVRVSLLTLLLIGSGVDKLLHLNQRAHALILLASKLSASQLKSVLIEGVAVNAGTKMHDWLLRQIDRHNLNQADHGAVGRCGTSSRMCPCSPR